MLTGRPVRGTSVDLELFVNYDGALERLEGSATAGLNALVLGGRGSGKTSLRNVLAGRLEPRFECLSIDGQLVNDAPEFFSLVAWTLDRSERRRNDTPLAYIPAISARPPLGETLQLLELLDAVHAAIERRPRSVVVLVDDLPPALAHTIFGRMRDEVWTLGCIWFVTGDVRDRATFLRPPADAFFEAVIELPPLDHLDAVELLRRRFADDSVDEEALNHIARLADGNPRRLLQLAREVFLEGANVDEALSRSVRLHAQAAQLGDAARRLTEDLSIHGPASASDEDLLRRLGWTRGRATQVFKRLEENGIVRATAERGARSVRKVYDLIEDAPS